MAAKDISIPINPEVFIWLRKSSGWTHEDVSAVLDISVIKVIEWEKGDDFPSLSQLKKLAHAYKRPLAAFLLPQPETDNPLPTDFRLLPEANSKFTKDCLIKIREAQNLQDKSRELMLNLNMELNPDIDKFSLNDNPEDAASKERRKIGLTFEKQKSWKNFHESFNHLRAEIEKKNILVFQMKADMEDLRGFSLMTTKPFVIVVNQSDAIQARIFTLLHEYAHILLNEPALCIPHEDIVVKNHKGIVESWCNSFAAAFILPEVDIIRDFQRFGFDYKKIANRYKASYSATLTRLFKLNCISQIEYDEEIRILQRSIEKSSDKKIDRDFGINSAKRAKSEKGLTFISLVLENADNNLITTSEVLDYLNIKTKHIDELTNF